MHVYAPRYTVGCTGNTADRRTVENCVKKMFEFIVNYTMLCYVMVCYCIVADDDDDDDDDDGDDDDDDDD
eukprot:15444155-Heterocapsa_arctica.AAC.1